MTAGHPSASPVLGAAGAEHATATGPLEFEAVYDAHVDFVWRTMWRLGVPESQLEDAVQDAFVVVHRRLAEFEGRSALRTWLFGIAMRVAKDHRRSIRRKGPQDPLDEHMRDPSLDPSATTERNEALRVLARLLDELDDDKRALFVMSEIEQIPVREMALALGENANTVYSRLRVAREEFDRAVARHRRRER